MDSENVDLSMSGCGFLGIYHVGVAAAIKEFVPEMQRCGRMAGCSAGALVAAALMCDCCLGQATTDTLKLVIMARSTPLGPLRPSFCLVNLLRDAFDEMLPANAHEICSGRLFISLTRFTDGRNVLVSQYESKQELIQALLCSAFIPFYCGTVPPTLRGVRYIDGGLSMNQPVLPPRADGQPAYQITVSPWSGESDICPADEDSASWLGVEMSKTSFRFTARNLYRLTVALFPPHPEVMSKMCRQGFEDALRFLTRNGLVSCARCLAVRSCIQLPESSAQYSLNGSHSLSPYAPASAALQPPACATSSHDEHAGGAAVFGFAHDDEEPVDCYKPLYAKAPPNVAVDDDDDDDDEVPEMPVNVKKSATTANTKQLLDLERRRANSRSHARLRAETKQRSQIFQRHRHDTTDLDETCESCVEVMEHAPKKGLPPKITKKFEEAKLPNPGLVSYVTNSCAFRMFRYMMLPYALPIEFVYTCCVKLLEWLPSIADDARWLVDRIGLGVRLLLHTIEQQRHVYSARFSCQLAITELNYASAGLGGLGQLEPTHNTGTYCDHSEARFGITADLSGQAAKPLRKQWHDYLHETKRGSVDVPAADRRESQFDESKRIADATVNLQWKALRHNEAGPSAVTAGNEEPANDDAADQPQPSVEEQEMVDERDTVAAIVEFTRRHEALMAFHYLDDNDGQVRVTEIFGMDSIDQMSLPAHNMAAWRRSLTRKRASSGRKSNASANSADVVITNGSPAQADACSSFYATESPAAAAAAATHGNGHVHFGDGHNNSERQSWRRSADLEQQQQQQQQQVGQSSPVQSRLQRSSSRRSWQQPPAVSDEDDDDDGLFVPRSAARLPSMQGYEAESDD